MDNAICELCWSADAITTIAEIPACRNCADKAEAKGELEDERQQEDAALDNE